MPVVLFSLGMVIQKGYQLHDTVTGAMILEESLEKTRYNRAEEKKPEDFAREGTERGTPRLWLGAYEVEIQTAGAGYLGTASAGDWKQEMEWDGFEPGKTLRKYQALYKTALGKERDEKDEDAG